MRAVVPLTTRKLWQELSSLLGDAANRLPHLSPRSIGRGEHEYRLTSFNAPTAQAVSVTFQAGEEPAHCLKLLEIGRGIMMGLVIDC